MKKCFEHSDNEGIHGVFLNVAQVAVFYLKNIHMYHIHIYNVFIYLDI